MSRQQLYDHSEDLQKIATRLVAGLFLFIGILIGLLIDHYIIPAL